MSTLPRPDFDPLSGRATSPSRASNGASPPAASPEKAVSTNPTVLIVGLGSLRHGDEGAGILVAHQLEIESLPSGIHVVPQESAEFLMRLCRARAVLLVSSTRDGRPPGRISYLRLQSLSELEVSLKDVPFSKHLVSQAASADQGCPELHLYTISISQLDSSGPNLSDAIAAAVAPLAWVLHAHARRLASQHRMQSEDE